MKIAYFIVNFVIALFLIFTLNFSAFSMTEKITHTNKLQENKSKVMAMYQYFESLRKKPIRLSDLSKYYTRKVKMIINGKVVAAGIPEFYEHFKFMLKKSRDFKFVFSKNPMIAEENRVAIKYQIVMHGKAKTRIMHVVAYLTLFDGKISLWNEVVSSDSPKKLELIKS